MHDTMIVRSCATLGSYLSHLPNGNRVWERQWSDRWKLVDIPEGDYESDLVGSGVSLVVGHFVEEYVALKLESNTCNTQLLKNHERQTSGAKYENMHGTCG